MPEDPGVLIDIVVSALTGLVNGSRDFVQYVEELSQIERAGYDPFLAVQTLQTSSHGGLSLKESADAANFAFEAGLADTEADLAYIASIANDLQPYNQSYPATMDQIFDVAVYEEGSAASDLEVHNFPFAEIESNYPNVLEAQQQRLGYLAKVGQKQTEGQHLNRMTAWNVLNTTIDDFWMQSAMSLADDMFNPSIVQDMFPHMLSPEPVFDSATNLFGTPNPYDLLPSNAEIFGAAAGPINGPLVEWAMTEGRSQLMRELDAWGFPGAALFTSLEDYHGMTDTDTSYQFSDTADLMLEQVKQLDPADLMHDGGLQPIFEDLFNTNVILEDVQGLWDQITNIMNDGNGQENENGFEIPLSFEFMEGALGAIQETFDNLFSTGESEEGSAGFQIPIGIDRTLADEGLTALQLAINQITGMGEEDEGLLHQIMFAVDPEGQALSSINDLWMNLLRVVGGEGDEQTPWIVDVIAGEGFTDSESKVAGMLSNLQTIAGKTWTATVSIIQQVLGGGSEPGKQYGGPVSTTGMYLVGETGPELVTLPQGANVTPSTRTQSLLQGAGGGSSSGIHQNVAVHVDFHGVADARGAQELVEVLRRELRAQGMDFAEVR